jgi:hypothetical protein
MMRNRIVPASLLTVAILALLASSSAAQLPPPKRRGLVLKVNPADPRAFHTIGEAVAAARENDTISISPQGGPYRECIDVVGRFSVRFDGGKGKEKVVIDGTGACPDTQPAFSISLSRHIYVKNIELRGNPAGIGFFIDHTGDVWLGDVLVSGFGGCGLVSTLSAVAIRIEKSDFRGNPGGGLCLNGNGFWITNTTTDDNGAAGVRFEGVTGGRPLNAFFEGHRSGPDEAVGITNEASAGLDNVFVSSSSFGSRGMQPVPGAIGIAGDGRNLDVSRSAFYGMGLELDASGNLSRNKIDGRQDAGIATGPAPLGMVLDGNSVTNCSGSGFDLTGTIANGNTASGNGGDGYVARDGVYLERNSARGNGGSGFSRDGTDNAGQGNRSDDPVPPDFQ